jgi:hypothetical protein
VHIHEVECYPDSPYIQYLIELAGCKDHQQHQVKHPLIKQGPVHTIYLGHAYQFLEHGEVYQEVGKRGFEAGQTKEVHSRKRSNSAKPIGWVEASDPLKQKVFPVFNVLKAEKDYKPANHKEQLHAIVAVGKIELLAKIMSVQTSVCCSVMIEYDQKSGDSSQGIHK